MTAIDPPAGYVRFAFGKADVTAREALADSVREALRFSPDEDRTLFGYAASSPAALALAGRGTAYAVALPRSNARVVVRHNRHGGLLARFTGDRFLTPTNAPRELATALALERLGVPTPDVVAYALYPAGPGFRSADVVTAEIEQSRDLASYLMNGTEEDRAAAWSATRALLRELAGAGVWHQDLNAKNILLQVGAGRSLAAQLLDVDRVKVLGRGTSVMKRNVARLTRSVHKWGRLHGAVVDESELAALARSS